MMFKIRLAVDSDHQSWLEMRLQLWPGSEADHKREIQEYFDRKTHQTWIAVDDREQPFKKP